VVILSNHVPELLSIVEGVGIGDLVDEVFSSAVIGYEKPNPEAFRIALCGVAPSERFMVGDNPEVDVLGAERLGLRAILVRSQSSDSLRRADDLLGATKLILDAL
jgi:putative hydrolase of the HAD superfamily